MTTPVHYFFDLGNTRGKFWRVRAGVVEAHVALAHRGAPGEVLAELPDAFREAPSRICGISVLGPAVDREFIEAARAQWGCVPELAASEASFGALTNAYREAPGRLGVDRWMGLIAAAGECDGVCVVGCGTAITIDVLQGGCHQGGYILPGLDLMQSALHVGTRRVRVEASPAPSISPGDNTAAAVRNGALAAIVALVERAASDSGAGMVLLTGGDAPVVAEFLTCPSRVEPELLLKGMMRYFDDRRGPPPEGMPPEVRG